MKEYFLRLSSLERRFVVGVLLIIFVLLNWVFIRPLFYDWAKYQARRQKATETLKKFQDTIAQSERYKPLVARLEGEGMAVPAEDQTVNFMLTIQQQATTSGVQIQNNARIPEKTNQFFVERLQNVSLISGESELVDFLYSLGSGNSLIRVRGLSLHPDQPRQKLAATATLVASFQKKVAPRPAAPAPAPAKPAADKPAADKSKPAEAGPPKPAPAEKAKSSTGEAAPAASGVPRPPPPPTRK